MFIYKITNLINGKSYIGQTTKPLLENRIREHINCNSTVISKAIHKYGIGNFDCSIIEQCDSKEELDEMEFHYIKQYNSFGKNGYNLTFGGEGTYGYTFNHTEETKKKMSKSKKNKKMSYTHRKNSTEAKKGKKNPMYGKNLSEDHKRKISEGIKRSGGFSGWTHTKESREKIKEARKKQVGKNHPQIKIWKLTSPSGEVFIVDYGLENFCNIHNLCLPRLRKNLSNGKVKRGHSKKTERVMNTIDWQIEMFNKD